MAITKDDQDFFIQICFFVNKKQIDWLKRKKSRNKENIEEQCAQQRKEEIILMNFSPVSKNLELSIATANMVIMVVTNTENIAFD